MSRHFATLLIHLISTTICDIYLIVQMRKLEVCICIKSCPDWVAERMNLPWFYIIFTCLMAPSPRDPAVMPTFASTLLESSGAHMLFNIWYRRGLLPLRVYRLTLTLNKWTVANSVVWKPFLSVSINFVFPLALVVISLVSFCVKKCMTNSYCEFPFIHLNSIYSWPLNNAGVRPLLKVKKSI